MKAPINFPLSWGNLHGSVLQIPRLTVLDQKERDKSPQVLPFLLKDCDERARTGKGLSLFSLRLNELEQNTHAHVQGDDYRLMFALENVWIIGSHLMCKVIL